MVQVVVRRLPPALPEEILLRVLEPYRKDFDDFYFIVGDPTYATNMKTRPSS